MHGSLEMVYGPSPAGIEEPLERLQAFAELTAAALAPSATRAVPRRPDASSPDVAGLGEQSEAS